MIVPTEEATLESVYARLAELRGAFDLGYAAPEPLRESEPVDLLAIEVAHHPYALRVRELLGLFVERRVTPLPAAPPELLGLAAMRGELVAVYDLASLLGYARGENPRFLVLARGHSVAFAFGTLHGHVRVPRSAIATSESAPEVFLTEVVSERGGVRPIIELAGIADTLEERMRSDGQKENGEHG